MLIEAVHTAKYGILRKHRISVENQIILGMKVMVMTIPLPTRLRQWQLDRIKRQVFEFLRKFRINTVCLKTDFQYPEWFSGYRKPDGHELINRFLGDIAIKSTNQHEAVYVYLNRWDRYSFKAITDMCQSFRHIMLAGKSIDIADRLYKNYGVSVIVDPAAERIANADAAVFFTEPSEMPDFKDKCVIIKADNTLNVEFALVNGEKFDIPDGYSPIALIYEAILRGCMTFEDIYIIKTEISP